MVVINNEQTVAALTPLMDVGYISPTHIFSINDILGDFGGTAYAEDTSIIASGGTAEVPTLTDKDGNVLAPIDSEFGFQVSDFFEAIQKERDNDYQEGWAGNIVGNTGGVIGLALVNAETDLYKSGQPLGTWAAGLGGNTVKASTEHYNVMAALLSDQDYPASPDGSSNDSEATYSLDNNLKIISYERDEKGDLVFDENGDLVPTPLHDQFVDDVLDLMGALPVSPDLNGDGVLDIRDILVPNESSVTENIAYSNDYSVTLKDDGKLLYRWGTAIKRPNDIRMQVQLDLPDPWMLDTDLNQDGIADVTQINDGKGYKITRAELVVNHDITNNPNDQIRPEDYENEAAIGRKPSYYIVQDPENAGNTLWVSPVDSYGGDRSFLPSYFKLTETGEVDLTAGGQAVLDPDGNLVGYRNTDVAGNFIGTVLRDFSLIDLNDTAKLSFTSSDLDSGFTNAWYISTDRDPFEWSYDIYAEDPYRQVFAGFSSREAAAAAGFTDDQLVSGSRWRLTSNKFGQDIPGVEIPLISNSKPPFEKDNIRYSVGETTTTVINLLDWADENDNALADDSPLLYSSGWTTIDPTRLDADGDGQVDDGWTNLVYDDSGNLIEAVTPNGLNLTPDSFDAAVYLKGDRRDSAKLYNMQLVLEYETDPSVFPDLNIGLYDADTDTLITSIGYDEEILASTLLDRNLTIAAFVPEASFLADQVESMFLNLNDGQVTKTENIVPYALFGDDGSDFTAGFFPLEDNNTITFDLYSQNNLGGELLGTIARDFTIVDDIDGSLDLDVGLYDANTDELITLIERGEDILASVLVGRNVTIAAFVPENSILADQVESMFLNLNDGQVTKTENVEPYALFGDSSSDFKGKNLLLEGDNAIAFDLYSKNNLKGESLGTVTRNFTIVQDVSDASVFTNNIQNASSALPTTLAVDSSNLVTAQAKEDGIAISDVDEPLNNSPTYTTSRRFSTADIIGKFDGTTQGDLGAGDVSIVNFDAEPNLTKEGIALYPVNSEFGFNVTDFEGAEPKDFVLDPEYEEGWTGNLTTGTGEQLGLVVSNAPTATFQAPYLLGTWLVGMGGDAVKASTEHYVTMQNVLSDQYFPDDPDAVYPLDNNLIVVGGEFDGEAVSDVVAQLELTGNDRNGDGLYSILDALAPNESSVTENIAVSNDYSVTLKDDGKLLHRWGNLVKRPTDIRIRTELPLPEEWGTGLYQVTQAELVVRHTISNNPNDQIRPEDYENEAAAGRLPNYTVNSADQWVSTEDFYAGDGTFLPAGTVLKDLAVTENSQGSILDTLGALSSDLEQGFTNAWYTTQDREPFEPILDGDSYEVGPRWRLKSNKYGQDLPGVEISLDPSQPPPPTKDEIKYEVGAETQTVINLLDWSDPDLSPLSLSAGWQSGVGDVTENGLALSDNFDVAFYIKGDQKPVTLYDAELAMSYEEVSIFGTGEDITGSADSDILVGEGANTFAGGDADDLFVLSYGATDIATSTITDFDINEDTIGLINLGVTADNLAARLTQQLTANGLSLALNGTALATLTGIDEELASDRFYFA